MWHKPDVTVPRDDSLPPKPAPMIGMSAIVGTLASSIEESQHEAGLYLSASGTGPDIGQPILRALFTPCPSAHMHIEYRGKS